jgi:hypothetical protein
MPDWVILTTSALEELPKAGTQIGHALDRRRCFALVCCIRRSSAATACVDLGTEPQKCESGDEAGDKLVALMPVRTPLSTPGTSAGLVSSNDESRTRACCSALIFAGVRSKVTNAQFFTHDRPESLRVFEQTAENTGTALGRLTKREVPAFFPIWQQLTGHPAGFDLIRDVDGILRGLT